MLHHPRILGGPQQKGTKSELKTYAKGHHDAPRNKAWIQRLSRFPQWQRNVGAQKRAEMLHHPCILGGPQQREQNQKSKPTPGVTMIQSLSRFPQWHRKVGAHKRGEMLHHLCILGCPQQREQNQNSKPPLRVTMMHHATKCGFKDYPGFVNSIGRLGPTRGQK